MAPHLGVKVFSAECIGRFSRGCLPCSFLQTMIGCNFAVSEKLETCENLISTPPRLVLLVHNHSYPPENEMISIKKQISGGLLITQDCTHTSPFRKAFFSLVKVCPKQFKNAYH